MKFDDCEYPTLTKAQLAQMLHQSVGLNKRESKDLVDAFFYVLSDALIQGQDVKLSGFGNFQVRAKAARPGLNPKTKEVVHIAPRHVVTFHPSQRLRELLREAAGANTGADLGLNQDKGHLAIDV